MFPGLLRVAREFNSDRSRFRTSPPGPLSNFAPTALRGEGEPDKPRGSFPPLHAALRSNAELERGLGGEARRPCGSVGHFHVSWVRCELRANPAERRPRNIL
jgi:hypothetical protein